MSNPQGGDEDEAEREFDEALRRLEHTPWRPRRGPLVRLAALLIVAMILLGSAVMLWVGLRGLLG